jgi:hypothetical protein
MNMSTQALTAGTVGASSEVEIERILADPKSKEFKDLRDRAAYMYITGTHPSHLRTFFTRALTLVSKMHSKPVSFDGLSGMLKLEDRIVQKLDLENHAMVRKVREFVADGYKIKVSRGPNSRKPYTKIFMFKGPTQLTVQIDGSILDGWPD